MPRLTRDQWDSCRAEREAGATFAELSKRFAVSVGAIHKRAKLESWSDGQDVGEAVRRKVNEKVNGIVNTVDHKKRAEAIDAAADRCAAVVARHQAELAEHAALFPISEVRADFSLGKSAKISAEVLAIRQKAERIAWGIDTSDQKHEIIVQRSYA